MQYTYCQKKKFFIYSNKSKLLYGFPGDHKKMHIFLPILMSLTICQYT